MQDDIIDNPSVGLIFVLVKHLLDNTDQQLLHMFSQGLVLVYVSMILMVMVRQFRMLDSLEEDINRCVVVDHSGQTNMKTVRCTYQT